MPDERVGTFLGRSHRRVLEHCDALLARPLTDEQRSRLLALRAAAEADLRSWEDERPREPQRFGAAARALEFAA